MNERIFSPTSTCVTSNFDIVEVYAFIIFDVFEMSTCFFDNFEIILYNFETSCYFNIIEMGVPTLTFGERLKSARKAKKLTQKELALRINAAHNSISNWENDQNKPDPDTIQNLCWVLEVTPNYFFFDAEQPTPVSESGPSSEAMRIARAYDAAEEKDRRAVRVILSVEEDAPSFAIAARGGKTIPVPKGKQLADMPDDPEADKENSRF